MKVAEKVRPTGCLLFGDRGVTYAVIHLDPVSYGHRPTAEKQWVRELHTMLYQSLPAQATLLGMCHQTSHASVIEPMVEGIDLEAQARWLDEVDATLTVLEDGIDGVPFRTGDRSHFLVVPLPQNQIQAVKAGCESVAGELFDVLGLDGRPSPQAIERREMQVDSLLADLPMPFNPRRATAEEVKWIYEANQLRGTWNEPDLPDPEVASQWSSPLVSPVVDEGGRSDRSWWKHFTGNPLARRYVKITPHHGEGSSYQTLLALTGVPADGVVFPGCEWLGLIDNCGESVDYAVRMTVARSHEVTARNRKAIRRLNEEYEEREGEVRAGSDLVRVYRDTVTYQEFFDHDENEVEIGATVILAVGGDDGEDCQARAKRVSKYFSQFKFVYAPLLGAQKDLWEAFLPAVRTSALIRSVAQYTTASYFASAVPLISPRLGDPHGALFAKQLSNINGYIKPIYLSLDAKSKNNQGATVLSVGEMGTGKSHCSKTIGIDHIDRINTQIVALDHSKHGEWVDALAYLPEKSVCAIKFSKDALYSVDPLRILPPGVAERAEKTMLSMLLNVDRGTHLSDALGIVLGREYLEKYQIGSTLALMNHLLGLEDAPSGVSAREQRFLSEAINLGLRLKEYADLDVATPLFSPDLAIPDVDDASLIFLTFHLDVPKESDMATDAKLRRLSSEKIFGQAMNALVATIAKYVCFRTRDRFALFIADECAPIMGSDEGLDVCLEIAREGRKNFSGMVLSSQVLIDFLSEALKGLIFCRMVFRTSDETMAKNALKYVGLNPDDEENIDMVTKDLSPIGANQKVVPGREGEALMRFADGSIGLVKVLSPMDPVRAAGLSSTPGDSVALAA